MKVAIVLAVTILAVSALSEKTHWENFKVKHNKNYLNLVEENYRFQIFQNNLKAIEEHNKRYEAGEVSYYQGVNQFADLTKAEFSALMGYRSSNLSSELESYQYQGLEVPDAFDWRDKGAVLAVRDQEECGSCWAFSAVGALEGQNYIVNGKSDLLSPQELVDCSDSYGYTDCILGGEMLKAFAYVKDNGLDSEKSYSYKGYKAACKSKSPKSIKIKGFKQVEKDEKVMKEAVATVGPISIALDAKPLHFYKGGIVDSGCNPVNVDHAVLIVGYGTENDVDYWIVKNSWGANFGEEGFFRIKRGVDQCGLTIEPSYPIL